MATLQQLQATCLGLLFSTQAHPVGFAKLDVKRDVSILTNREEHLLLLYDKLEQVCLEQRILEAELSGVGIGATDDDDDDDGQAPIEEKLRIAEEKLLQSKAKTAMKGRVVEMTLVTQPVLKAVHLSSRSTAKEHALSPLIHRRDTLSVTHANLSRALSTALESLSQVQTSHAAAQALNRQLTARLLTLSAERDSKSRKAAASKSEAYREAEEALREARVKWEVMRNTVQAVIVGSGVDWVRDGRLREVVLDCGYEEMD